jgi:hypothetical protein
VVTKDSHDFGVTTEVSPQGVLVRVEIFREVTTRAVLEKFFEGARALCDAVEADQEDAILAFVRAFEINATVVRVDESGNHESVDQDKPNFCECKFCVAKRKSEGPQA